MNLVDLLRKYEGPLSTLAEYGWLRFSFDGSMYTLLRKSETWAYASASEMRDGVSNRIYSDLLSRYPILGITCSGGRKVRGIDILLTIEVRNRRVR